MESEDIGDDQITASSSFDYESVGPQNARIRTEKASGAWCPKLQIRNGSYEFIQVNFNQTQIIRGIETQGRYGNGTGREFAPQYLIDYWRTGNTWVRYRNRTGHQLMTGNFDTVTAVLRSLDPPIIGAKIRLVPFSLQTRTICMRIEIHGCGYEDGLVSYTLSNIGSKNGAKDFSDKFLIEANESKGGDPKKGLGLLFDGNIAETTPNTSNKSFDWIGWNRTETGGSVEILFEFDRTKNFTDIELNVFGSPKTKVAVDLSTNGQIYYNSNSIASKTGIDLKVKSPGLYTIQLPLFSTRARYIRIGLQFEDEWFYISEVNFNTALLSKTIDENGTEEVHLFSLYYILIAVLVLLFIFLCLIFCILIFVQRSHTKKKSSSSNSSKCVLVTSLKSNGMPRHIIHSNASLNRHPEIFHGNFYIADQLNGSTQKILGGNTTSSRSTSESFNKDKPPSLLDIHFPPPPSYNSSDGVYSEPPPTTPLLANSIPSSIRSFPRKPKVPPRRASHESLARQNRTLPSRPTESSELHYAATNISFATKSSDQLAQIPQVSKHLINRRQKIGEGKFTVIHICDCLGVNRPTCIKSLKDSDNEAAKKALISEAKILSAMDHPNIIKFYGVDEDLGLVLECMSCGSVRDFLQREPHIKSDHKSLVHICTQISSGMKYLEERRIVHGHLSPRNCLVEKNLHVKIASTRGPNHHAQLRYSAPESIILNAWSHKSDVWSFGVSAWEILHGCDTTPFSGLSNAELIENAQNILNRISPTICLEFQSNFHKESSEWKSWNETMELIKECWNSDTSSRPNFLEVQLFLTRKNMDFSLNRALSNTIPQLPK
uniref:Uncharacterized protein n=1 Tax=Acrobeloides nanus TaxID=290746 RepID=A0A914C487_9BILA